MELSNNPVLLVDQEKGSPTALSSSPVLLIDGDIVAYRCAAVAEKTKYLVEHEVEKTMPKHYDWVMKFDSAKEAKTHAEEAAQFSWPSVIWSRKDLQPLEFACNAAHTTLDAIIKRFPNGSIKVYLSGERNFRDNVWVTKKYKGNRDTPKPTHLKGVREYLISKWDAVVSKDQEADDDIGIDSRLGETIVVSTDKDLDQIPGWHYNWVKEEVYYITPEDAEQFFWEQVISGDVTDNIPGLPGYGPAKARTYLDSVDNSEQGVSTHDWVYDLFKKEGFGYEYFDEMCKLIKILQEPR